MTSIADAAVSIQTSEQSVPSTPSWFGEVTLLAHYLKREGVLGALEERVRFARPRFGHYEVIDFVAVLMGYALSGEATLQAFYERLVPFAQPFMALFGRTRLPHRSTLSRFLAAIDSPTLEALRSLFHADLTARLRPETAPAGLWDRAGRHWVVVDVDGTRQAARQRALPQTAELPSPHRRLEQVCAAGYLGRKRGEVVRTRTTVLQAHTCQWIGTFSGAGNGDYRGELLRACEAITSYARQVSIPLQQVIVRLDGLYGNAAPLIDLLSAGLGVIVRGKDYALLDLEVVQARLAQSPDQQLTHPETGTQRDLFDCPDLPLTATGPRLRGIVARHPATSTKSPIGITRDGLVYELFYTALPQETFTAADVVELYLHRGAFETVLADEDREQEADRWCSHTPCGQEFWQVISQWMWNLRLELGLLLHPTPVRTTIFSPAHSPSNEPSAPVPPLAPTACEPAAITYGPPKLAQASQMGGFAGTAFLPQPDGTLRCPANQPLYAQERRPERDGSVRVLYAARIGNCRPCPLREQCLGHGAATKKPRRVSAVLWPIQAPSSSESDPVVSPVPALVADQPILWRDCPRCQTRREWRQLLHTQTVTITVLAAPGETRTRPADQGPLSRGQRAHWRLSWPQRLARNAAAALRPSFQVHLFGIPPSLASVLGLQSNATAV